MRYSVVIPCYNEARNLPELFRRLRDAIAGRRDVEAVLVNNGSTDDSAAVFACELARPEHRFARLVTVPRNKGYGFGIMAGLRAATGEFIGWTHADLQTDPQDVIDGFDRLASATEPRRCLLRGRRVGRGWFDAAFTGGMSLVASLVLGSRLNDINAQPKLFHRGFLEQLTNPPDDFALDLYLLHAARRARMRFLDQPVHFGKRLAGEAKGGGSLWGKVRLTRRTIAYIRNLRANLRNAA